MSDSSEEVSVLLTITWWRQHLEEDCQ